MTQHFLKVVVYIWLFFQVIYSQNDHEFDCLKIFSSPPGTLQKREEYTVNCSEFDSNCKPASPLVFLKDQLLRNGKWNATMVTQSHSLEKEISMAFKVMGTTRQSGELFEVFLVKLVTDDCNGRRILQNGHTFLKDNVLIDRQIFNYTDTNNTVWKFSNLSPGTYCIKVYPWDCYCIRTLKMGKECTLLNSAVVVLNDVAELIAPVKKRDPELRYWQEDLTSVSVIGSIILAISVCNLLLYKMFKRRRRRHPQDNVNLQREEYIEMVIVPPSMEEKNSPFILSFPDEETTSRVFALKKILLAATGINAISPEPHLLSIAGGGAIQTMQRSKIIIVVETDAAIDLQRKSEQIWLSMVYSKDSDDGAGPSTEPFECELRNGCGSTSILENHFVAELAFLTSGLVRSLKDYNHIFVIQFKDLAPSRKFMKLVPNERYILPDCMLQLCLDLLGEKVDSPTLQENLKSAMKKYWKFDN